jgi:RNA polymerase sigma-70 factor (ECF subfamily)
LTEKEFIKAIQEHAGIIYKIVYLYVDDPEDQRDMRQEIQLQAWRSIKNFRGESAFSTWLYRVALNTVFTHNKKKRLQSEPLLVGTLNIPAENNERSERSELLLRAIKQLLDIDKTIITLHLEEYGNQEIANIIGLSPNNVGVKIHRIKELLKGMLTPPLR